MFGKCLGKLPKIVQGRILHALWGRNLQTSLFPLFCYIATLHGAGQRHLHVFFFFFFFFFVRRLFKNWQKGKESSGPKHFALNIFCRAQTWYMWYALGKPRDDVKGWWKAGHAERRSLRADDIWTLLQKMTKWHKSATIVVGTFSESTVNYGCFRSSRCGGRRVYAVGVISTVTLGNCHSSKIRKHKLC